MLRKLWEEKIRNKRFGLLVAGLVYGGAVCLLCQLLIRNGDMLLPLFGLDSKTADHIGQVLGQLRHSTIRSPWLLTAAICGVLGYLVSRILSRKKRIVTAVTLAVVLLLPMFLGVLWFTQINGIMVGKLLLSVLPWL